MAYITKISATTQKHREYLKRSIDDFASFMWAGLDAFEEYGAFIINDKKGSLKFYNGPSFSNTYSQPQFSPSAGNLTGVSFKQQTIPFKVGVYWISIEKYQEFLEWLNPYRIDYLTFNFEPKWSYLVKLGKITDSPRHIVGYEDNEPRYYTELDLTWEIQGPSCVRANLPYEWNVTRNGISYVFTLNEKQELFGQSFLDTPINMLNSIVCYAADGRLSKPEISLSYRQEDQEVELFNVKLKNLPGTRLDNCEIRQFNGKGSMATHHEGLQSIYWYHNNIWESIDTISVSEAKTGEMELFFDDSKVTWNEQIAVDFSQNNPSSTDWLLQQTDIVFNNLESGSFTDLFGIGTDRQYHINIQYDSEAGLLLFQSGNTSWKLLNYLTNNTDGDFVVDYLSIKKFSIPGKVSRIIPLDESNNPSIQFVLNIKHGYLAYNTIMKKEQLVYNYGTSITSYQRTNVI